MSEQNDALKVTRRNFIFRSLLGVIGAVGLNRFLSACSGIQGSSVVSPTAGGNCITNGTSISIQVQHTPTHTLTIPASDVSVGIQKTYTLADNGSGHTHTVTLTAQDFASLAGNQGIQETSTTTNSHTHIVTVNCA